MKWLYLGAGLALGSSVVADSLYPTFLPSAILGSGGHDAQQPTSPKNGVVDRPDKLKAGWEDNWSAEGVLDAAESAVSRAGSGMEDQIGPVVGSVGGTGPVNVGEPPIAKPNKAENPSDQDEGYYRTIRETVEWVKPTTQPRPYHSPHHSNSHPALAPATAQSPTPTPEPAHIKQLAPYLVHLSSLAIFFLKHPYRFLRSIILPSTTHLVAFLATRLAWPILRLPLSLLWAVATTLLAVLTAPLRWAAGVWDRWGELGLFFGGAVGVGCGMGVVGAVASGPGTRRLLGGLLGRAKDDASARGSGEARWERIPGGRRGRSGGRVGGGIGAFPTGPAKVRRSDSLDTVRPTATQKPAASSSAYSTGANPASHRPAIPSLHVTQSWASSATSPPFNASTRLPSASASSSEMGRESSRESNGAESGSRAGAGVGRAGPARNAASVALAEARRRVEAIRVAKERERGGA